MQARSQELAHTGIDGVEAANCFVGLMPVDEQVHREGTVTNAYGLAERESGRLCNGIVSCRDSDEPLILMRSDRGVHGIEA